MPNVSSGPSTKAIEVLRALKQHHNVLISGPPATGKSYLLAEVRRWFAPPTGIGFDPTGAQGYFPSMPELNDASEWLPSAERTHRRTWSDTFHQGTRYRDFVGGIRPSLSVGGAHFEVHRGILLEAADYALTPDGASLVIVDEINRGPAVAVFGAVIGAMERGKRRAPDGTHTPYTVTFRVLNSSGVEEDYALPHHLYIIAAMNEADTSIEPLDVAFRRRFHPVRLVPDEGLLRAYFHLTSVAASLPRAPTEAAHVYDAATKAWARINRVIEIARGREFQIGHGIFMDATDPPADLDRALDYVVPVWDRLLSHTAEVFFGDTRGVIEVLRARVPGSPFGVEEHEFADSPAERLVIPSAIGSNQIYSVLSHVAGI